jgi:tetratricopeptide (TPR) repeat protein
MPVSDDERAQLEDYLGQGLRLEDQGAFEEALALYAQARERFPQDPRPPHRMGVMCIRLGRREEARAHFEAALAQAREYAPALTNLGNMALEAGDVDKAVELYRRAIVSSPDYPGAHHNLAVALRRQGRLAEAVSEQRAAARLERTYGREMDRLRLRAARSARGGARAGCLGGGAAAALVLTAGAVALAHLHLG